MPLISKNDLDEVSLDTHSILPQKFAGAVFLALIAATRSTCFIVSRILLSHCYCCVTSPIGTCSLREASGVFGIQVKTSIRVAGIEVKVKIAFVHGYARGEREEGEDEWGAEVQYFAQLEEVIA